MFTSSAHELVSNFGHIYFLQFSPNLFLWCV